jgi:hypothetical protein
VIRGSCAAVGLLCLSACLDDLKLEERTFPCREPGDCAEGFFCHPQRFVCVPIGTSTVTGDAGAITGMDASSEPDAGGGRIGERCVGRPCEEGTCVDGYCCDQPCDGVCERCDITPGQCSPTIAGVDPDNECGGMIECKAFTFGLVGSSCVAYGDGQGQGVCDGMRHCKVSGCEGAAPGSQLVACGNTQCLRPSACPAGAPSTEWDELTELCAAGAACGDGLQGCCSPMGRCCPSPACSDQDPLCQ